MKKKKTLVILVAVILGFILLGKWYCVWQDGDFENQPVQLLSASSSPEEVVKKYLEYQAQNNIEGMTSLKYEDLTRDYDINDVVKYIQIVKVERFPSLENINLDVIEKFGEENVMDVNAVYDIDYKYDFFNQDERRDWHYWLVRENNQSSWVIYSCGCC